MVYGKANNPRSLAESSHWGHEKDCSGLLLLWHRNPQCLISPGGVWKGTHQKPETPTTLETCFLQPPQESWELLGGLSSPEDQILGGPWIAAKIKRPIVEGGWLP